MRIESGLVVPAFLGEGGGAVIEATGVIRGELDDLTELLSGLGKTRLSDIKVAQPVVCSPVVGAQGDSAFVSVFGVGEPAQAKISLSEALIGGVVGGLVLKHRGEFTRGVGVVAGALVEAAEASVGRGEFGVQLDGLLASFAASLEGLGLFLIEVTMPVGLAQASVSQGVVGVEGERVFEHLDGTGDIFVAFVVLEIAETLKVVVISTGDLRAVIFGDDGASEAGIHPKHVESAADDGIFGCEGVADRNGKALGADLTMRTRVNENKIDTHAIADAMQASFDDEVDTKLSTGFFGGGDTLGAEIRGGNNLEFWIAGKLSEFCGKCFRQTGAERGGFHITAIRREGKDGNLLFRGKRDARDVAENQEQSDQPGQNKRRDHPEFTIADRRQEPGIAADDRSECATRMVEAAEIDGEFLGGLVAVVWVAFQALVDDAHEFGGDPGIERTDGRRSAAQDFVHEFKVIEGREGRRAGGHLVKDGASGVNVGARVDVSAEDLFGSHVGESASDGLTSGDGFSRGAAGGSEAEFGQSEIENLEAAVRSDAEVAWFEIAMNDGVIMCGGKALGELRAERENVPLGERAIEEFLIEGNAFDELHDEIVAAVVGEEVEDGGDVGMVELGKSMGFVQEATVGVGIGDGAGVKQLDGDFAVEVGVVRAIDDSHATATDAFENAIVAELQTEQGIVEGGLVRHGKNSFPRAVTSR